MLGRSFTAAEDTAGGPRAVVLSYRLFKNTFNGGAHIIGQAVRLKGVPYTVIGVLPPGAQTPSSVDLWTSLRPETSEEGGGDNFDPIVRLKDGATWQQVDAQLSQLHSLTSRVLQKKYPGAQISYYAVPLQQSLAVETRTPAMILMSAVGFVLLVACANLAGLALVRVGRRDSEIATRLALGAAMQNIPGVESAAVGLSVPYERALNYAVRIADGSQTGEQDMTNLVYVTPGYFAALQIPLRAGRLLAVSDTSTSQFVAVVNGAFASKYLGRENSVGRHLLSDGNTIEIVGITANVVAPPGFTSGAPMVAEPTVYVPATQMPTQLVNLAHVWFQPSWIVRTKAKFSGVTQQMQQVFGTVDPDLPISGFYGMNDVLAEALLLQHVEVGLLAALAGLALLLSSVGIYGLVSNLVSQRTRELGIRMALGCTVRGAMVEVSRTGIAATGAGLAVGLLLSFAAVKALRSQLFGVALYDPLTLFAVCALLALVALLAAVLPTFRIASIDPAETLRAQ
jgi:ABC-type antimicrobial peptide transport system permease subunit